MTAILQNPLDFAGPVPTPACQFETLKIIVVGTPKTGNTWLTHLFAELYELPRVRLDADFRGMDWDGLGARWVGQQHYQPEPALLELARERGIVFVTPVRHPGDVFVSLRHYTDNRAERDEEPAAVQAERPDAMLADGKGIYGPATRHYLEHGFYLKLHLSIYWLRGGWSHGVRYEDLWLRPIDTLTAVTERFLPQPRHKIRRALCACSIGIMKQVQDPTGALVRRGGINGWRDELPHDLQHVLAERAPYPAQLAALGYSMSLDDPANQRVVEPAAAGNPFPGGRFANGVPVAPILMHIYFEKTKADPDRWAEGADVGPGSFYAWLLRPAEADPTDGKGVPVITEFAYFFYEMRQDLPEVFPDPFGADRRALGDWFLHSARREFEFDDAFVMPVIESWARG
jgi:hypothetical protein